MLSPAHRRWLHATVDYLQLQGHVQVDSAMERCRFAPVEPVDVLWQRWDAEKNAWLGNANHRSYLVLIEACLRKLPEILRGDVAATAVMFPESSVHLVEGIYKHNLVADHFNHILADCLKSELTARIARGERGIRLLEIGAGTGGTTALLLPMLRELGDAIVEYCYTDLSKAFLLHAQQHYQPLLPSLRTAVFDVSKPLAKQTISGSRYDAVIATNVLHATPNIRETLRNAKAVLKRHGMLLINEISAWSWYTHFTFGLLNDWWGYEDASLRLPGSPGLSPRQWQGVLEAERFVDIRFAATDDHGLGQQIIVATSDGVVRQRLATKAEPSKAPAIAAPARATVPVSAVAADDAMLREKAAALFREVIAAALKMDARELETHKALETYGLDSILVVQLTTHFRKLFPSVRSSLFFEVQSIDGLVQHFVTQDRATLTSVLEAQGETVAPLRSVQPERRRLAAAKTASVSQPQVANADSHSVFDVAVIGISGRYPKATDLDQLWLNLAAGRHCVDEIPAERWQWQSYYDPEKGKAGRSYTKWGGFLDHIDRFDPLFFKIAPREAGRIDPQERLFLETSYHAIEDSGYTPDTLAPNGKVGVFVGAMNSRYTVQPMYYSIANRVSYLFNFTGPSFAVDSACSSSLTAIHLALESLYGGMCDTAIAGGVNLIVDPRHMLELTAGGWLSEGSQCRSFGQNGDGFVDAEGVGAVILKPLARAQRDRDNIYAVIKGTAVNAGGRTHGYTVPNVTAQADVVSKALARANIDAADVSYLEAHGTGTALGDPIEVAGLTKAFNASRRTAASDRPQRQYCAIGSLKSNLGHCESAAGIAGLSKVILQLKHRQLVPTLHAEAVNEEIDFSTTPFKLQRELAPWHRPTVGDASGRREIPRIAGISSFGAGGANAHAVIQEYQALETDAAYRDWLNRWGACIVPLSARTSEQLQQKIQQLHAFVSRHAARVNLVELAYSLQVGREAMEERLALIASSIDDLQRQLLALSSAAQAERESYRGTVKQHKDLIAACKADPDFTQHVVSWIAQNDWARLAQHWAKGVEIDWARLYPDQRPRRISLPLYPFARDRHWIEPQRTPGNAQTIAQPISQIIDQSHALLQRNTSMLRYPAFSTSLNGDEPFIVEDATGQRVLPFALCIEMARAAIATAYPKDAAASDLRFEGIVWADAIVVDAAAELHIALVPDGEQTVGFEIYSAREAQECIHCQGRVQFEPKRNATSADFAALTERLSSADPAEASADGVVRRIVHLDRELLLEFSLAQTLAPGEWGLPPGVLECMTRGAALLLSGLGRAPSASVEWQGRELQTLHLHARCSQRGYLRLREKNAARTRDDEAELEVQLFDATGELCLAASGLRVQRVRDPVAGAPITKEQPASPRTKKRVAFLTVTASVPSAEVMTAKPNSICLEAIQNTDIRVARPTSPATITLSEPGRTIEAEAPAARVSLYEHGEGVFSITLEHCVLDATAQDQLRQALQTVQQRPDARAVLITGSEAEFLHGDRQSLSRAIGGGIYEALLAFPLPTIAVMQGNASGAGFLLGALCDFMICSRESRYGFADPQQNICPTSAETELLAARFGDIWAEDLLFISGAQSGQTLLEKGWSCPIVAPAQVIPTALALAMSVAAKPRDALSLLKKHLASALQAQVARLDSNSAPYEDTCASMLEPRQMLSLETLSERDGVAIQKSSDFVVTLCLRNDGSEPDAPALLRNIQATLEELAHSGGCRALLIRSEHRDFLPALDGSWEPEWAALQAALSAFPVPIIAAFERDASGLGWLFGLSCDACVYAERGQYSPSALWQSPALLQRAVPLFERRLGERLTKKLLFDVSVVSGTELASCAGIIAPAAEVLARAQSLAETGPLSSPALFRQWRARNAVRPEHAEQAAQCFQPAGSDVAQNIIKGRRSSSFVSASPAIETEARGNGVLVVRMVDRNTKNLFSPELIQGLEDVFAHIEASDQYSVVVLCGYDTYFASGGTKETLLAIQQGKVKFTDSKVFQLPMSCKLPVIAAMQGHAIGGGWMLGMFSDVCLFSAASRYISPYMQYGFTPGAGATLILPATLGVDLAKDTLFTAAEYTGSELQAKGLIHRCLARGEVMSQALAQADALATRRREDLIALKRYFSARWLAVLDATYEHELAMHEKSFVGRQDALSGIHQHFMEEGEQVAVAAEPIAPALDAAAAAAIGRDLKALLAAELQMNVDDIDEDARFVDLGLDSIIGVTWIKKINSEYRTQIEATKVYSYPTLRQFSEFVRQRIPARATEKSAAEKAPPRALAQVDARAHENARKPVTSLRNRSSRPHQAATHEEQAIAVIGMAGQFPQASTLEVYWQNIASARDCIDPIPVQRWNIGDYFNDDISVPGTTNCRWLGALEDADAFDPLFFNISPTEAESMDPQQRLLLQCCWHTIENAAIDARALSGSRCGVFIGCGATDYHQRSWEHQYSAQGFTGASMAILAARIAYFLNLQGPCLSIDTACSSSLVAIATACDNLVAHNCDVALAGGVAVIAGPTMHIKTAQSGMLSVDGRCFAFDHRANGFVPAEGVGVVMLKRLADAERDGDIIHATIRGWGVNQDGKTNGITAPNPVSQTRLMRSVYDRFAIDPEDIQLVEAHGTGTKLGDPIEVEGLNHAFRHYTQKRRYCSLGSVKSNIGHCTFAAGVASVLKLVLALKHQKLPPAANFERLNEHIDLADSPFVIDTQLKPWPAGAKGRRLAAVSSFGFSGTNAHLVLEASPQRADTPPEDFPSQPLMIPLSAKTREQLREKARDLADFIVKHDAALSLIDIAYTLQVGREAMSERCATVARTKQELAERLRAFAAGQVPQNLYVGSTSARASKLAFIQQDSDLQAALIEKCIGDGKIDRLMELWADGFDLPWERLQRPARRIELPLYPFAKERYWLAEDKPPAARAADGATSAIHPLLHINASTLARQRYRTTFRGDEFFLRDHRVRITDGLIANVLPGVAYLEMAAAAVADALPERAATQLVAISNVTWSRPVIVNEPTTVAVEVGIEKDATLTFEIVSEQGEERVLHCRGEADFVDAGDAPKADVEYFAAALERDGWRADDIYVAFPHLGLHYGPAHRGIEKLCRVDGKVLARISLPAVVASHNASYRLHPSLMDAALQASIGFLPSLQTLPRAPSVPFALQSLFIHAPCPSEVYVVLTPTRPQVDGAAVDSCDVAVYALDGRLCVQMEGFISRILGTQAAAKPIAAPAFDEAFYQDLLASIANQEVLVEEAVALE